MNLFWGNKKNRTRLKPSEFIFDRSHVLNRKTPFLTVEEYKAIRTNIIFSIPTDGCKVIGLTSAEMMEGKSINCLNLAITFAQTGARVLLMDCDLRLPKIARLLAMTATPGISNVLVGLSSLEEAIQQTDYVGLDVIHSGNIPPNPSELLGSLKMRAVIEELKNRYSYILIDTPPVNVVSDAVVLSEFFSGVILVARSGVSEKESVKNTVEQFQFVNANILGFILNAVPDARTKRNKSYYRKKGQYGRYGNTESEGILQKELSEEALLPR